MLKLFCRLLLFYFFFLDELFEGAKGFSQSRGLSAVIQDGMFMLVDRSHAVLWLCLLHVWHVS